MKRTVLLALLTIHAAFGVSAAAGGELVINGRALNQQEMLVVHQLEQMYGNRAVPGRYWYDPVSGAYGVEGQPMAGQLPPNLRLGGQLRASASNGDTNVFINGRELHRAEVAYLSRCTQVIPGRYWVDALGNGGIEGGPMLFNLNQLCARSRVRTTGGHSWYGSVAGDGQTVGAIFPDGTGVTCGPDGGCIY